MTLNIYVNFITMLFLSFIVFLMLTIFTLYIPRKYVIKIFQLNHRINSLIQYLITITFFIFFVGSIYSIILNHRIIYYQYFFSIFVFSLTLAIIKKDDKSKFFLLFYMISSLLLIPLASIAVQHKILLTSDEGRFIGFAYDIGKDGRWIPFKYPENTYYQFFHVVPFIYWLASSITGLEPVPYVHILLVLYINLIISLSIYIFAIRFLKKYSIIKTKYALFIVLFYMLAPELFISSVIPRYISLTLASLGLLSIAILYEEHWSKVTYLILLIIISVSGVITHATYPVLILPFSILLYVTSKISSNNSLKTMEYTLVILIVITLGYWSATIILDQIMNIGKNIYNSIFELLNGETLPSISTSNRPTWYAHAPPQLAIPWILVPALGASYFITCLKSFMHRNKRNILAKDAIPFNLAFWGLSLLALGVLQKFTRYPITSYFYSALLLLLLPALKIVIDILNKRSLIGGLVIVAMITVSSVYAIQDPAFSPDMHRILLICDARSYITSKTLSKLAWNIAPSGPLSGRGIYTDQRIGIGVSVFLGGIHEVHSRWELVIIGNDKQGLTWIKYWLVPINLKAYSAVFNDGLYVGYIYEAK